MRIIELKGQNIKIIYKPSMMQLKLGDYVSFIEGKNTLIAQIYRISASGMSDEYNQAELYFVLKQSYGKISAWNGEFVSVEAKLEKTNSKVIEKYINKTSDMTNNLTFGLNKFALSNFSTPAIIGSEKQVDAINLLQNIVPQMAVCGEKTVIIDYNGNIEIPEAQRIFAGPQVKLPLNSFLLENLAKKILDGVSVESRAVIDDILFELSNYARECAKGFISLTQLINVIDDIYKKSKIAQLILLKNKLRRYQKLDLFADTQNDFTAIFTELANNNVIIYDLSKIPEDWKNDFLLNLVQENKTFKQKFYLYLNVDEKSFTNSMLNYMLFKANKDNINPVLSINYKNSALENIIDFSKNIFLFKSYNVLKKYPNLVEILQNLPQGSMIVNGQLTTRLNIITTVMPSCDEIIENIEESQEYQDNNAVLDVIQDNISLVSSKKLKTTLENMNAENLNSLSSSDYTNVANASSIEISDIEQSDEVIENVEIEPVIEQPQNAEIALDDLAEPDEQDEKTEEVEPVDERIEDVENINSGISEENIQAESAELELVEMPLNNVEVADNNLNADEILYFAQEQLSDDNEKNTKLPQTEENEIQINNDGEYVINVEDSDADLEAELIQEDGIDLDVLEDSISMESSDGGNDNSSEQYVEVQQDNEPDDLLEDLNLDDLDFLDSVSTDDNSENVNVDEIDFDEIQEEVDTETESSSSKLPIYSANYGEKKDDTAFEFQIGDLVKHNKYGVGTISEITPHGNQIFCHINFDSCGRRLLDPAISPIEKIQ